MQLHNIKPIHKLKEKKRIGRGGKRGTYSGRGMKGQKSRAGTSFEPVVRGLIKKFPKLRGYKFNKYKIEPTIVNVSVLESKFETNDKITPLFLLERKIVNKVKGKVPKIKILGKGNLTKAFIIENCAVSKSAKEKIEKNKGKII
ncbi:MAG: 50S ribosomal protein L15 [Patescibacteria group bacterium]|nr:50S ribosomal protein L15 [Patescibacteria group bacterium]